MERTLWFFNWTVGGYNSVYAGPTKEQALEEIKKQFPTCGLKVDESTLVSGLEAKKLRDQYDKAYSTWD